MSSPKRLLCIVGGMNAGGAETFLMKTYRELDKNKYQMDFYVSSKDKGFYEEEILSMGGRIFRSQPKSKGFLKSFLALKKRVKVENYKNVMRVSQHSLSTLDLLAAKLGGANNLIYRSSNSKTGGGRLNQILHVLFKWLSISIPTIKIAPSTEAAIFMFGKSSIEKKEAVIIRNSIPVSHYIYNIDGREKIRKEFNISKETLVFGHVGRFNYQKNHDFLIEIFKEITHRHYNSVLILVGKGELENTIKTKIKEYNLENKVIFTGVRRDIPDLMMAMDAFIFPSLFEGMPNTVIEAQATGMLCFISDNITREVQISTLVNYISKNDSPEKWAENVLIHKYPYIRKNMDTEFNEAGYDIGSNIKKIEELLYKN